MTTWPETTQTYLATLHLATAKQYRAALDDFAAWYTQSYGEQPDPALLTDEEVREWRGYLLGVRKLAASTVNVRLAAVKGLARFAGRELRTKGVKQVQAPVEVLTGRDLGRLEAAIEGHRWGPDWLVKRNLAIIAVMARAGLRVGEVVALDVRDIELNKRSGWATIRRGKGLKERKVPLSLQTRKALQAYLDAQPNLIEALFIAYRSGKRLSKRAVQGMVKDVVRRADITKKVTPHILRHTLATRFIEKGGDIATCSKILGHKNITTTSRYLHPTAQQMQAQVEDL